MNNGSAEFVSLLESGDVAGLRKAWKHFAPNMPQPKTFEAAEIVLHHARTQAQSVTLGARAYSHKWLTERGLPSGLPDHLKPSAERLYPRIVLAVGIATRDKLDEAGLEIRRAQELAVLEAEADGKLADAPYVKGRMLLARHKAQRQLYGV